MQPCESGSAYYLASSEAMRATTSCRAHLTFVNHLLNRTGPKKAVDEACLQLTGSPHTSHCLLVRCRVPIRVKENEPARRQTEDETLFRRGACLCARILLSGGQLAHLFAPMRLIPQPPAFEERRKANTPGSLLKESTTACDMRQHRLSFDGQCGFRQVCHEGRRPLLQ